MVCIQRLFKYHDLYKLDRVLQICKPIYMYEYNQRYFMIYVWKHKYEYAPL